MYTVVNGEKLCFVGGGAYKINCKAGRKEVGSHSIIENDQRGLKIKNWKPLWSLRLVGGFDELY